MRANNEIVISMSYGLSENRQVERSFSYAAFTSRWQPALVRSLLLLAGTLPIVLGAARNIEPLSLVAT